MKRKKLNWNDIRRIREGTPTGNEISQEEITQAVDTYLAEGGKITEITPNWTEGPASIRDRTYADDFLSGILVAVLVVAPSSSILSYINHTLY